MQPNAGLPTKAIWDKHRPAGPAILREVVPLFEVDKESGGVSRIEPTTFPVLRLWERQDLEAWVTSVSDLALGDFSLVTSEFDRFDRTSERLDVLGIVQPMGS